MSTMNLSPIFPPGHQRSKPKRTTAGNRPHGSPWCRVVELLAFGWLLLFSAACRPAPQQGTPGSGGSPGDEHPQVVATPSGIEMVLIPAGTFQMGSTRGEPDEQPVHEVHVDAFLMDRYEVTQEQFAKIAQGNPFLSQDPSHFKGAKRPVEMISWDMAALFCNERSRIEGLEPCYDEETGRCNFEANGYRLPTEAEWEYACRAGSDAEYGFGSDAGQLNHYAWFAENSGKQTHPVGQKKPNAWGLYDMHGNVAEWCNDFYDEHYYARSARENPRGPAEGEQYVLRGGAWNCSAAACRAARRVGEDPGFADACFAQDAVGFRCVRRATGNSQQPDPAEPAGEAPGGPPENTSAQGANENPANVHPVPTVSPEASRKPESFPTASGRSGPVAAITVAAPAARRNTVGGFRVDPLAVPVDSPPRAPTE